MISYDIFCFTFFYRFCVDVLTQVRKMTGHVDIIGHGTMTFILGLDWDIELYKM